MNQNIANKMQQATAETIGNLMVQLIQREAVIEDLRSQLKDLMKSEAAPKTEDRKPSRPLSQSAS